MQEDLKEFTQHLAQRVRSEERKRMWRFSIAVVGLSMVLLGLIVQMQQQDAQLRHTVFEQCQARNKILSLQRESYVKFIAVAPEAERPIYSELLARLPHGQQCEDYLRN